MATTITGRKVLNSTIAAGAAQRHNHLGRIVALVAFGTPDDHRSRAADIALREKGSVLSAMGFSVQTMVVPSDASADLVRDVVNHLNEDSRVVGVIVHRPIPGAIGAALSKLNADKNLDGNADAPSRFTISAVSEAVLRLLRPFLRNGPTVAVVGANGTVGKEVVAQLGVRGVAVKALDKGSDLHILRTADLIVSAAGVPGLIGKEHLSSANKLVVDVGYIPQRVGHRTIAKGDVDREAYDLPAAITPVPGGLSLFHLATVAERALGKVGTSIEQWNSA